MRDPAPSFPYKVFEHCTGSFKIGDDSIDEWRNHHYVASFTTLHLARLVADRTHTPVTLLTATKEGSSTTTPRPRTATIVPADPMSIAIESETRLRRARSPTKERVLLMNDIVSQKNTNAE